VGCVLHKPLKIAASLSNCMAVEQQAMKCCLCSEGNRAILHDKRNIVIGEHIETLEDDS